MRGGSRIVAVVLMSGAVTCSAVAAEGVVIADAMRGPALKDVRLGGYPGAKLNDLIRERATSRFAREEIFGEARRAFIDRDDDVRGHGGLWRGEFWGKLMLSSARVADYLDPNGDRPPLRAE